MPDPDLIALLDQIDAEPTPAAAPAPQAGARDDNLLALLDDVENDRVQIPEQQFKPVAPGMAQAFQNASAQVGQTLLAAPALAD